MLKRLFLLGAIALFITPVQVYSQETEQTKEGIFELGFGADLMSRYVWRGTAFSTSPSIQPGVELGIGSLSIGAWGAYSFNGMDGAEADLYLSYSFLNDMLSVTFTDYFFPTDTLGASNKYFVYDEDKTGHVFEGTLAFNGTDNLPLTFLVATNFYGADSRKIVDDANSADFNTDDGLQYSTYMEVGYASQIGGADVNFFLGFTPNDPKEPDDDTGYLGESGYYGHSMGIVNLGFACSKEVKITDDYGLPIQASLITNPMSENIFIVCGISF